MKISAHHKKNGDDVEWVSTWDSYDLVYKSKVFTFSPDETHYIDSREIISGGTGYLDFKELPYDIEHIYPDYSLYNVEEAYGFLTRGCIRKCSFCIVPQKEGHIKKNADIEEFWDGQKVAILMDNNVLASDWGLSQIEKIIKLGVKIDFNQGIDARIISENEDIAKLLSRVRWHKPIKMACDNKRQMPSIGRAVELLRKHGATPSRYQVFVLVKDVDDALHRVEFLRKLNLDPFAQPYINFNGKSNVTKEQKRFARWVNHKAIFKSVEFKNYNR